MRKLTNEINHMGTKTLQTQRLLLRKITDEDTDFIYKYMACDEKIIDFLDWDSAPTPQSVRQHIKGVISAYENSLSTYNWLITLKDTREIVGMILVDSFSNERRAAEVDYCIVSSKRGKGYASETLTAVIRYLIFEVNFFRVEAVHNLDNIASGKVMEKVGMQYEGTLRGRAIRLDGNGHPEHLKMYAIIATDLTP